MEVHEGNDQFFRFEKGTGKVVIDGNEYEVGDGVAVVVPAGAQHNVINTSDSEGLKLYTIYSPAHHKDGIIRATKADAASQEAEFDGTTTETMKKYMQFQLVVYLLIFIRPSFSNI